MAQKKNQVAPSYLGVTEDKLEAFLACIQKNKANMIHADLGDGSFITENSSWEILKKVAQLAKLPLDLHLMVDSLDEWLDFIVADILPIMSKPLYVVMHIESKGFNPDFIENLIKADIKVGLAIKPETSISAIQDYLWQLSIVNVMTVIPGKSGQTMITDCLDKVIKLSKLKSNKGYRYKIQVDGGVGQETAQEVINKQAEVLVCGGFIQSVINDSAEVKRRIQWLQNLKRNL